MAGGDIPQIRVVVRLPFNRPENPPEDPPSVKWTPEKADILWKVIEKSRTRENVKTDWKSLAERLDVPLPYLLYRVHARFQEELRGLSNIPGIVTPSTSPTAGKEEFPFNSEAPPQTVAGRAVSRMASSSRMSGGSVGRNSTPLGIRARLSSLGANSPRPKRASSSSTLTLQGPGLRSAPLRPPTPSSSEGSTDSEEDEMNKEEEAQRRDEEQMNWDKQLKDLQRRMTTDALGLVSTGRKGKGIDRGRMGTITPLSIGVGTYSNRSGSQSLSSTSSPQGSIPDIPSPPPESQPHSPISRHMSPTKSVSPPAVSPRSALSQSHRRYTHLDGWSASEHSSGHGSRASSSGFSDLASDASVSASDLASALESNIRGTTTRFSTFARSRLHR
ncbi:hypothetical protein BDZ89DRAFT_499047 [Hymenopellis radicata]|nr:hypothetical protein BDZ89DRAFT_499047 [Hymenopellis radicata]